MEHSDVPRKTKAPSAAHTDGALVFDWTVRHLRRSFLGTFLRFSSAQFFVIPSAIQ